MPLSALTGFIAGRKKTGIFSGLELTLALMLALAFSKPAGADPHALAVFGLIAGPLTGALGMLGASIRQRWLPFRGCKQEVSRADLLGLLEALQSVLADEERQHAPLSAEVDPADADAGEGGELRPPLAGDPVSSSRGGAGPHGTS
jgi:hypothetical protein